MVENGKDSTLQDTSLYIARLCLQDKRDVPQRLPFALRPSEASAGAAFQTQLGHPGHSESEILVEPRMVLLYELHSHLVFKLFDSLLRPLSRLQAKTSLIQTPRPLHRRALGR